jgi:hypothetical protein
MPNLANCGKFCKGSCQFWHTVGISYAKFSELWKVLCHFWRSVFAHSGDVLEFQVTNSSTNNCVPIFLSSIMFNLLRFDYSVAEVIAAAVGVATTDLGYYQEQS